MTEQEINDFAEKLDNIGLMEPVHYYKKKYVELMKFHFEKKEIDVENINLIDNTFVILFITMLPRLLARFQYLTFNKLQTENIIEAFDDFFDEHYNKENIIKDWCAEMVYKSNFIDVFLEKFNDENYEKEILFNL
jgi:hypothetical protein